MTADLLARLAQRPWAGIQRSVMTDSMARDLAEFDRALLLDAVEYRDQARRKCDAHLERIIDGQGSDEAMYRLDVVEAHAANEALRTIVATLRSEP
jgi:hypothetical protein